MEPDSSLPHSQVPATCPYPKPDYSSPCPQTTSLKIHLNVISHLRLGLPSGLFPSGFSTKTLYTSLLSPIYVPCPAHPIPFYLITRTIFGEGYTSLRSSLLEYKIVEQ